MKTCIKCGVEKDLSEFYTPNRSCCKACELRISSERKRLKTISEFPFIDGESWRGITGYEGYYQVSDLGRVRSLFYSNGRKIIFNRLKLLKPAITRDGYLQVTLCVNGSKQQWSIHRLVLSTFTETRDDLQVNHINGIKSDNRLINLEWCTQSENMLHAYRIGLEKPCDNGFKKTVSIVKDGAIIQTYESIREMCRVEGLDRRAVMRVIKGRFTNHKGYTFKVG
ncbi:hypothetical protein SDC9_122885 [bioreactor metagenome]|uniref:HNH nuclease domain-containing protein n=1 Tax=bioreactor metagenome TaxID=1076179 RepID=A0A645CG65_9ZZZZ